MKTKTNIFSKFGKFGAGIVCAMGTAACGYDAAMNVVGCVKARGTEDADIIGTAAATAKDVGLGVLLGKCAVDIFKNSGKKTDTADDLEAEAETIKSNQQ